MTVALAAALGSPAAHDAAAEDGASVLVRSVTGVPSWEVPGDAGGDIVDEAAAVDGNIITSRNPDDVPAFTEALAKALLS